MVELFPAQQHRPNGAHPGQDHHVTLGPGDPCSSADRTR